MVNIFKNSKLYEKFKSSKLTRKGSKDLFRALNNFFVSFELLHFLYSFVFLKMFPFISRFENCLSVSSFNFFPKFQAFESLFVNFGQWTFLHEFRAFEIFFVNFQYKICSSIWRFLNSFSSVSFWNIILEFFNISSIKISIWQFRTFVKKFISFECYLRSELLNIVSSFLDFLNCLSVSSFWNYALQFQEFQHFLSVWSFKFFSKVLNF